MAVSTDHESLRKDMEYVDDAPVNGTLDDLEETTYRLEDIEQTWERYLLWLSEDREARSIRAEKIANKILWGIDPEEAHYA